MNLADGVVASEHVEVEGLGVFTNTCPCADVRSGPPSEKTLWSEVKITKLQSILLEENCACVERK